jgi:hypothetical protein
MKTSTLTVAILIDDIVQARALALSFRKLGIVPYYYDTLRSYWDDIFLKEAGEYPDFNIIDVKMMSDGKLFLAGHPAVKAGELCLSFYYSEENKPLLNSTYDIFNFGEIRKAANYDGQLKTILNRVNQYREASKGKQAVESEVKVLRKQNASMLGQVNELKERDDYLSILLGLSQKLDENLLVNEFNYALLETFTSWDICTSIALYELSQNGQRLLSSNYQLDQLQELPSLWLGQACPEGVESFAETMASQVAFDLMGDSVALVRICGTRSKPEMLMFLKVDSDYFHGMQWDLLGQFITSSYRAYRVEQGEGRERELLGDIVSPWDLLGDLDREFHNLKVGKEASSRNVLVNLDFSRLLNVLKDNNYLRFHWSDFQKDFLYQIRRNLSCEFQTSYWGTGHMTLIVDRNDSEPLQSAVKDLVGRFAFWRYFEDSTLIMNMEIAPEVKQIPYSPTAYLRYIEKVDVRNETTIARKAQSETSRINGPIGKRRPDLTM